MSDHRDIILRRRAAFLASSLAALGCGPEAVPAPTTAEPVPTQPQPTSAPASQPVKPPTAEPVTQPTAQPPAPARKPVAIVCLSLRILPKIEFAPGSLTPSPSSQAIIDEAVAVLKERPDIRLMLEGHRDATEEPYGRKVSELRAEAVRKRMVAAGIDAARLCTRGFGEDRPLTPGKTPTDRARNRRVELRALADDETCD